MSPCWNLVSFSCQPPFQGSETLGYLVVAHHADGAAAACQHTQAAGKTCSQTSAWNWVPCLDMCSNVLAGAG
jgi:hypothetical protein